MSRLLSKLSNFRSNSDEDTSSSPAKTNDVPSRRREQVRRAQRTHRERRAKYLQGLEAEVAQLRAKNAANTRELRKSSIVNERLRNLLTANGITIPSDLEIVDDANTFTSIEVLGTVGETQTLRCYIPNAAKTQTSLAVPIDSHDSNLALEFVLALEQPCLADHHNNIGEDGEMGHSMQLQAAALQSAPPTISTSRGQQLPTGSRWNVLSSQLEEQLQRLHESATRLNLKDEMTPIMCWRKVQEQNSTQSITRGQLQQLQNELTQVMLCYGFGAVVDEELFYTALNKVLSSA